MGKVLLFQVANNDIDVIRDVLGTMKIRVQIIPKEQFRQTLGNLAEGKTQAGVEAYTDSEPSESLILMCGFDEKQMDKFLAALRNKRIVTDYKAILTPVNREWNVLRLYAELAREKAEYMKIMGK